MNVNLKEVVMQRLLLQELLMSDDVKITRPKLLKGLIRFLEEVEADLEIGGESIVELDMPRLEAIEERNKMLSFKKDNNE